MKPITIILPFYALFFGLSCRAKLPERAYGDGQDCTKFYDYVKQSWKKDSSGLFRLTLKPLYDETLSPYHRFTNSQCLIGLNRKQIIKLFSKPTVEKERRFDYYMNQKCYDTDSVGCVRLKIYFDSSGKVSSVPLIMRDEGPIK